MNTSRIELGTIGKIVNILALLAALAGLGLGLYALSGPLGVWLGLTDFRSGFSILQKVNPIADQVALGCLLVTLVAIAGLLFFRWGNSRRLTGLALLGTVTAALAYYVPESFRPPPGTPPIHDITTDTVNPPQFVAIAPLRANAANSMVYGSGRISEDTELTPETLARMQQEAYPDIVPQRFSESLDTVFNRAVAAAEQLGWDIVAAVRSDGRIEATDTTFWFRFKDDVIIKITREGDETVLNARSLSRVGVGDVGKNAARLREFFALL
ncbi:MAG: DUF1499 domain-containing protein [Gammaproteobacteria bacterium]|nr:DUF1499 domain-containing protein [Pseudomonadales bacterium]MCP5348060.1 DUF1499 domain-containing protein [Pseudomonadales bacterium]